MSNNFPMMGQTKNKKEISAAAKDLGLSVVKFSDGSYDLE